MKNHSKNISELFDIKGVLEHFGISRSTLWTWTNNDTQLPYVKIRGRKFFKVQDLNELIEKNYTTTSY
jgi:predicted DNA-binding transcriptional regulator AlpA